MTSSYGPLCSEILISSKAENICALIHDHVGDKFLVQCNIHSVQQCVMNYKCIICALMVFLKTQLFQDRSYIEKHYDAWKWCFFS